MMNVDDKEVQKFNDISYSWWDPEGPFKPLHMLNPVRINFIKKNIDLENKSLIDVGCGGGILTESLCTQGKNISGIDAAPKPLKVAQLHAMEQGLKIDYTLSTAESLSEKEAAQFDIVTCMEMLEHVKDFYSTIRACAILARPGADLFFSTINRNPISFFQLIIGAENLLDLLPKGTHDYQKFIKPSELASALRASELDLIDLSGISYNPFTRACHIGSNVRSNYIVHARKK